MDVIGDEMKYAVRGAIFAIFVAGVSGCAPSVPSGSPPTGPASESSETANASQAPSNDPSIQSETPVESTTPSRTATAAPALAGKAVFHLATREGYETSFTLSMSEPVSIPTTAVSNDCRALATATAPIDTSPVALKAITVTAEMDYTAVNGFAWPAARSLYVSVHGGSAAVCSSPESDGALGFELPSSSQGSTSFTTQVIYGSVMTPKNPTGAASPSNMNFSMANAAGDICKVTGLPNTENNSSEKCGVIYPGK